MRGRTMSVKEKDLQMIGYFRNNSRTSLTKLSRITRIPVSTLFDKLKEYEKSNIIKKHTSLVDFKKLGYDVKTHMLITANKDMKDNMQRFLVQHPRVNSVFRINNGFDFLIEAIFRNMNELDEFVKSLEEMNPKEKKEYFVMEDIKREEFLCYKDNLGILQ